MLTDGKPGDRRMEVREATSSDNQVLQALQARCPQGTSLIATVVNTPDFFARAKAYQEYRVYAASEHDQVIASAACGLRRAVIGAELHQVGYEFQYFTDPDHRGRGAARRLRESIEAWLVDRGASLSYALIMEANFPSIRLFEGQGFRRHRAVQLHVMLVYKEFDMAVHRVVRPIQAADYAAVAELLNRTWRDHDLYEPASADAVARLLARLPALDLGYVWVLQDGDRITACVAAWDISRITQLTVQALPVRYQILQAALKAVRLVRPAPRIPSVGEGWKQWCLPLIAFEEPEHLGVLLRYVNNAALHRGADQVLLIGERGDRLSVALKGLLSLTIDGYLYVKPLEVVSLGSNPVHVPGIDL
jgi:GNAT superfamily N-acetyltransferase